MSIIEQARKFITIPDDYVYIKTSIAVANAWVTLHWWEDANGLEDEVVIAYSPNGVPVHLCDPLGENKSNPKVSLEEKKKIALDYIRQYYPENVDNLFFISSTREEVSDQLCFQYRLNGSVVRFFETYLTITDTGHVSYFSYGGQLNKKQDNQLELVNKEEILKELLNPKRWILRMEETVPGKLEAYYSHPYLQSIENEDFLNEEEEETYYKVSEPSRIDSPILIIDKEVKLVEKNNNTSIYKLPNESTVRLSIDNDGRPSHLVLISHYKEDKASTIDTRIRVVSNFLHKYYAEYIPFIKLYTDEESNRVEVAFETYKGQRLFYNYIDVRIDGGTELITYFHVNDLPPLDLLQKGFEIRPVEELLSEQLLEQLMVQTMLDSNKLFNEEEMDEVEENNFLAWEYINIPFNYRVASKITESVIHGINAETGEIIE